MLIPKQNVDRIMIFIDGTNLAKALKAIYEIDRIDIAEFSKHLARGREIRGIYYAEAPYLPERGATNHAIQQRYLNHLKSLPGVIYRKGYYSKWTTLPLKNKPM